MLRTLLMVFHVLLAGGLVSLILLQRGKGAEVGTAFGAGASGTVFGARGSASFLTRATTVLALLFFVTSLTLAFLSGRVQAPKSILESQGVQTPADESSGAPAQSPQGSAQTPAAPETDEQPASGQPPDETSEGDGETQPDQ
jgi:preprotein translocase subunit SecG